MGIRVQGFGLRVKVWGLGFDVMVSGPRVYHLTLCNWILMFKMHGSGFQV